MIYMIAGHHNKDAGATKEHSIGLIKESELTKELRDLVIHYMKHTENFNNIKKDNDNMYLSELIKKLDKVATKDDLIIDIHFNAFNGKATGTEVIIPNIHSIKERELSLIISKEISNILNIPNRGVKTEKETARGRIAILKGTGQRILLEICFMDNPKDFTSYRINMYILAAKLAEVIVNYYIANIEK